MASAPEQDTLRMRRRSSVAGVGDLLWPVSIVMRICSRNRASRVYGAADLLGEQPPLVRRWQLVDWDGRVDTADELLDAHLVGVIDAGFVHVEPGGDQAVAVPPLAPGIGAGLVDGRSASSAARTSSAYAELAGPGLGSRSEALRSSWSWPRYAL